MYNIQKYRVAKDSQCLKGSDYSLHDRPNRTLGKLHRRASHLRGQSSEPSDRRGNTRRHDNKVTSHVTVFERASMSSGALIFSLMHLEGKSDV